MVPFIWLVSGPIRRKLWMATVAWWVAVALIGMLLALRQRIQRSEPLRWPLPLRGRWLRYFIDTVIAFAAIFCFLLFLSSGLFVFALFPWLSD